MMRLFTFFLLFFFSVTLYGDSPETYPYHHTEEVLEKNWMKVRVEGQEASYLRNPFRFVGYSIKAFKKKFTAPPETIEYFKKVNHVFDELAKAEQGKNSDLKLSLVGDIMWLRTGWSGFLDERLKTHLSSRDFLFGNLETLISKSHKVPTFPPARATFNSPPSVIDEFRNNDGVNLFSALSVANNHALDYGELGFKETLEVLQKRNIPFSGVLDSNYESTKKRWVSLNNKGIKIGFYAATYGMNNRWEEESEVDFNLLKGIAPHNPKGNVDLREVENVLKEMEEEKVELKIISLHWGFEYEYYPEATQVITAREIVKKGADIIMGHHSHSQQPLDVCFVNGEGNEIESLQSKKFSSLCRLSAPGRKRKALIVYGLGNFLTNMYGFLSEVGTLLDIELIKNNEGDWDWHSPALHLVYNERDYKKGKGEDPRLLLFMDDYLKENCFKKTCSKDDLKELSFLKGLYSSKVFKTKLNP